MTAKWKEKKNLKPEIILEKIASIITVSADNKVSFTNTEYFEAMATLQTMVVFPKRTKGLNKEELLSKAVSEVAKNGNLDKAKVMDSLNALIRQKLSTKEEIYHLLTSISLAKPYPAKRIIIEDFKIRILPGGYPKKYQGRSALIRSKGPKFGQESKDYTKVIVTTKARTPEGAGSECLRILDKQRAIWCLFSNSGMEILGDSWSPINKIRLGEAHTIHKSNGKIATNTFWYEPNFVKNMPHRLNSTRKYAKNCKWVMSQLEKCRYSELLKDVLLRYVRALDEKDQNIALIRLWSALECLTVPPNCNNYDLVIRRCSFLSKERKYYEQILEHLREYRNQNIHAGDQSNRAKSNCFQLQYFFFSLFMFHLHNVDEFSSLDEANNFLDLPLSKKTLENRRRLIDKALEFIS